MARPLRIELPGAIYHVTSRGDRREPIFADDLDRVMLLSVVAEASERFEATMWSYCLMGNHYHFVLQTHQVNLSGVTRHINGVYTQAFNARHGLTGHLFQGRFKAILVDTDAYLSEVGLGPCVEHLHWASQSPDLSRTLGVRGGTDKKADVTPAPCRNSVEVTFVTAQKPGHDVDLRSSRLLQPRHSPVESHLSKTFCRV